MKNKYGAFGKEMQELNVRVKYNAYHAIRQKKNPKVLQILKYIGISSDFSIYLKVLPEKTMFGFHFSKKIKG